MVLSGGLNGGSEPPAFQRAERKRIMAEEAAADRSENLDSSMFLGPAETYSKLLNVISDSLASPLPSPGSCFFILRGFKILIIFV